MTTPFTNKERTMGTYDKSQVFDIEQHVEESPVDPAIEIMTRVMDADRWFAKAQWYAMGRMFYEPAVLTNAAEQPDEVGTASGFAVLYQRMMVAFRDRQRTDVVPLHTAWANYTASLGGTLDA